MEINYTDLEKEFWKILEDQKHIVLATSFQNNVTARNVSHIVLNGKIYFQTDKSMQKINQIQNNNKVALCYENIQIEAIANILGHPFDKENEQFLEKFSQVQSYSKEQYSRMKNEVVVEVIPVKATFWKYEENKSLREFMDFANRKAIREYYNTSDVM